MRLIVIILVLLVQYFWAVRYCPQDGWFKSYTRWWTTKVNKPALWGSAWGLLTILLPIAIIIAAILFLLDHIYLILFLKFFLDLFVLYACIDATFLRKQLSESAAALSAPSEVAAAGQIPAHLRAETMDEEKFEEEAAGGVFIHAAESLFNKN